MPTRCTFVVAALLTAAVVDAASIPSPDAKVLYYLRADKLYRLKPPSLDEELLEHGVSNFELDGNGEPLWMDYAARIYRLGGELVLSYEPVVPSARFALDHATNKFYVVDGDSQEINVLESADMRALLWKDPIEGEPIVREKSKILALEPGSGLMFILTDLNGIKNIYRSDMDGTGKRKLVEDVSSDELSIDVQRRTVYWLNNNKLVVESVDFEGTNRQSINSLDGITNETAIAVFDGEIYWSAAEGLINTCKVHENSCDNSTFLQLKLSPSIHPIKNLKVSYNSAANDSTSTNACNSDNGGCQNMCLLNSQNTSSCVCYVGWEPDGKECKRRPKRQVRKTTPWYHYMLPQSTWKPQRDVNPSYGMGDLASHIAIIGK